MGALDDVAASRRAIVDALRSARAELGVTQQDLADALGVSRASVMRMESGAATPLLDNTIRALHLLGRDLVALPANDPSVLALRVSSTRAPRRVDRT